MTPEQRAAMEQALEALKSYYGYMEPLLTVFGGPRVPAEQSTTAKVEKAITALTAALEQPAQKCNYPYCGCDSKAWCKVERNAALDKMAENAREIGLDYEPVIDKSAAIRIATALGWEPKREWAGLTESEIIMCSSISILRFYDAIETKLREKNT